MNNNTCNMPAHVLIVDTDALFVQLIREMFRLHGWHATGFTCPTAALQAIEDNSIRAGLLIACMDRPGSPMQRLIDVARRQFPGLQCLIVSGDRKILPMVLPENTGFIHKPVRPSQLLLIAEELLAPRQAG